MEHLEPTTLKKARTINLDNQYYGTFAEIGAGQEIARYFFVAGRASQTIAKTISAYDMTFSDSIYGKSSRYVCEERVVKMLDHEFGLLTERLDQQRGKDTRFFVLADTVATSSHAEPTARCHGWVGVRFQSRPRGPTNDIILHVRMKDRARLQQQEALGMLGVNLLHLTYQLPNDYATMLKLLTENLGSERIEINVIRVQGPDLKAIDERLLNLEMVRLHITDAVLFTPDGRIAHPGDHFFKKHILVQRGTFRPVTNINQQLMEYGQKQLTSNPALQKQDLCAMWELTMNSLVPDESQGDKDFLDRVDTLCSLGYPVLLSNFNLFYQVKTFLRTYTDQSISLIIGAAHLEKLFSPEYYKSLTGGILEGFSRLFDGQSQVLVFPFKSATTCMTTASFFPSGALNQLYHYLLEDKRIIDIAGCDDLDTSIYSSDVREMLKSGDPNWQKLVPATVRDLIQKRKMFGLG